MSRAVVFTGYGGPEVLHVVDADPPAPGPGQLRVRARAAGVQPFDCLFRSGAAQQWMPAHFPQCLGNEFAGVIDALGEGTGSAAGTGSTAFAVGDEVLGWAVLACYADHVIVDPTAIVAKPPDMPWTTAGVLSAAGQTAATALDELGVGKEDTVLVHAAAGGVGSFAVQIAVARGATVIGTASERNHDYLRSLGAIPVAYGDGLVQRVRAAAPHGVDAALDAAGTFEALQTSVELVGEPTRVGTTTFQPAAGELGIRRISTQRSTARLAELVELHNGGALQATIQQAYPLDDAAAAHRDVETGHVRGKIVLIAGDAPS